MSRSSRTRRSRGPCTAGPKSDRRSRRTSTAPSPRCWRWSGGWVVNPMSATALPNITNRSSRGEAAAAVCAVAIILMLIVPLPHWMLDLLLALNITVALGILMVTFYVRHPLEFSSFPSLLLLVTLFRLSLNVSATRLILGEGDAGSMIAAFGSFVIRGNFVVGIVVFIILVVI